MQIAGAPPYLAPAPSSLPTRPVSPDVSPRLNRASPSPALPGQAADDPPAASAREAADPSAEQPSTDRTAASPRQQRLEQRQIAELLGRDREVRAHEQAHAAVGGRFANAPSYSYSRGPDGRRYALGGEVGIDVGVVPNAPAATLRKMEVVLRAALAPAEPSAQDLRVAAQARAQMVQARAELSELQRSEAAARRDERAAAEQGAQQEEASAPTRQAQPSAAGVASYRQLGGPQAVEVQIDLLA